MSHFSEKLKAQVRGAVREDPVSRAIYSVDASIYQIEPELIFIPEDKEDLQIAVKLAHTEKLPLIPRGAATGIAGGCIGKGLVLDLAQHMNQILEIDIEKERVRVQPGVVQNQLNEALAPYGYRLGPDTSTGDRATIGGMLANNSAGARSLRYGRTVESVLEVELMLADGQLVQLNSEDDNPFNERVARIISEQAENIRKNFPAIPRHVSGYTLDVLLDSQPLNLAKLIAGSEGSLGIATEITLKIVPLPKPTTFVILPFSSVNEAFERVKDLLEQDPLSLEMIDDKILDTGRQVREHQRAAELIPGNPKALLILELEDKNRAERLVLNELEAIWLEDESDRKAFMAMREAGQGLLLSKRSYSRAIAFLEDIAVSPKVLAPFMNEFMGLLRAHGKDAGIYGHAGAGCLHVRPYIDLRDPDEIKLMKKLMEETADLLLKHQGSLSGEHGDGFVRSWLNEKMFGPELYQAFREIKNIFDPKGLMNPGKVIATQEFTKNLRLDPQTQQRSINTEFDFSREGGIVLAADLCNGNGKCRKREGLMCPSFQAYGNEYHSTRARAQTLRSYFNGRLPEESWDGKEVYDVLEYCIECKGCKTECPSQVDVAKMKSEFLYHYKQNHGTPLRDRLFGHVDRFFALGSPLASLVNGVNRLYLMKKLLSWLGVSENRNLPALTSEKFSTWLAKQPKQGKEKPQVVLFNDTYTEYVNPSVGIATYTILKSLGFEIIVPERSCCGRPLISKGMLKEAKEKATKLASVLQSFHEKKMPIIVLEPSCLSALKDDYQDLLPNYEKMGTTLEQFLLDHLPQLKTHVKPCEDDLLLHTHCHHKALWTSKATLEILQVLTSGVVKEVETGCCGMAGSFGYEKEHYDFSIKIAEDKLYPTLEGREEEVIASGFSCRHQIEHGVQKKPLHLAEWISRILISN